MSEPIPGMDTLASARLRFPAMERWTYLDVAGRCPLSRATRAALDAHLDERMVNGANKEKFFDLIERTRARFASLIGADPDEIAYAKNVSDGLNMIATAFHWRRGDNVILFPELGTRTTSIPGSTCGATDWKCAPWSRARDTYRWTRSGREWMAAPAS